MALLHQRFHLAAGGGEDPLGVDQVGLALGEGQLGIGGGGLELETRHAALVARGAPLRLLHLERPGGALELFELDGKRRCRGRSLGPELIHPLGALDGGAEPGRHVRLLDLPVHPLLPRRFLLGFQRLLLGPGCPDGLIPAGAPDTEFLEQRADLGHAALGRLDRSRSRSSCCSLDATSRCNDATGRSVSSRAATASVRVPGGIEGNGRRPRCFGFRELRVRGCQCGLGGLDGALSRFDSAPSCRVGAAAKRPALVRPPERNTAPVARRSSRPRCRGPPSRPGPPGPTPRRGLRHARDRRAGLRSLPHRGPGSRAAVRVRRAEPPRARPGSLGSRPCPAPAPRAPIAEQALGQLGGLARGAEKSLRGPRTSLPNRSRAAISAAAAGASPTRSRSSSSSAGRRAVSRARDSSALRR